MSLDISHQESPSTMITRRQILAYASALSAPLIAPFSAHASNYPSMPLNIVTPLASGDAADTAARLMGHELSKSLGQAVTVINRPGAGGSIGAQSVIRSPKDGYTILFAQNSPLTIRRVIDPSSASYDPTTDLIPLGLSTRSPSILVARSDSKFKTLQELVAHAKQNPSTIRIGNAGPGSVGDISVQLLSSITNTDITSVNYKGAAPAVTDLIGGHIDAIILALGAVSAHMKSGTLKGLAISSKFPEFADVPTLGQLGYKSEIQGVWFGFFMPAGTPADITTRVSAELEKVAKNPAIAAQLQPMGIIQEWADGAALTREINAEYAQVKALLEKNKK